MDKIKLMRDVGFTDEAIDTAVSLIARAGSTGADADFDSLRSRLFAGEDLTGAISAAAEEAGMRFEELALVFLLSCADGTRERMLDQGFDETVFIDSMRDLWIWARFCYNNHGFWGIREFQWLSRTARAELWRLGRLQFELIPYEYDDLSFKGYSVKRGDTVLNMHIPAGGPIAEELRLDSYRRAYRHFGINTFLLDSYLLYKENEKMLGPDSNIVSLMHEYILVRHGETDSLHNLRYIFGETPNGTDPKTLPRDTTLRRAYAEHLEKTGVIGWGTGVMFFDGENIVK